MKRKHKKNSSVLLFIACVVIIFTVLAVHVSATQYTVTVTSTTANGNPWLIIGKYVYFYPRVSLDERIHDEIHPTKVMTNALGKATFNGTEDVNYEINIMGGSEYMQYSSPDLGANSTGIPTTLSVELERRPQLISYSPLSVTVSPPEVMKDQNYGWRYMSAVDPYDSTKYINYIEFHNGADVSKQLLGLSLAGETVKATCQGFLRQEGSALATGFYVQYYDVYNTFDIRFQHLATLSITNPQYPYPVSIGLPFGTVGNTGSSTGAHLHITVFSHPNGIYEDSVLTDPFGYCLTYLESIEGTPY